MLAQAREMEQRMARENARQRRKATDPRERAKEERKERQLRAMVKEQQRRKIAEQVLTSPRSSTSAHWPPESTH